jgi:hypothetical protein
MTALAHDPIETDWASEAIVARREKYYAASQRKFVPYATPLIFQRGEAQYLWDEQGKKYTDLLGMNLCISVGHAHPEVVKAASEQIAQLTHCTRRHELTVRDYRLPFAAPSDRPILGSIFVSDTPNGESRARDCILRLPTSRRPDVAGHEFTRQRLAR